MCDKLFIYLRGLSEHAAGVFHSLHGNDNFVCDVDFVEILKKDNIKFVSDFLGDLSKKDPYIARIIAEEILFACENIINSDDHKEFHDTAKDLHNLTTEIHKEFFHALEMKTWEECHDTRNKKINLAHGTLSKVRKKHADIQLSESDKRIIQHLKSLIEHSSNIHHWIKQKQAFHENYSEYHDIIKQEHWYHIIDFVEAFWEKDPHAASLIADELLELCQKIIDTPEHEKHHWWANVLKNLLKGSHDRSFKLLSYTPWNNDLKSRDDTLSIAFEILHNIKK